MALGDEVIEFGELLRVGEGELVGQPLRLLPWQADFVRQIFNRKRRRAILSVARRNGKTALVSVIVLAALFGPLVVPNSRIISASRSREQAALVFTYAVKMLQASGLLHLVHIRESAKEIICPKYGTHYRAISADASTAVGFGARLVIHDELGEVRGPRDDLFDALTSGMGTYSNSLEIIISSQAPSDEDLLSVLLDDAAAGHDDLTYAKLYAAPEGCDLLDEAAWYAANPSLEGGVRDLEDLRRNAREAKRLPSAEARFRNRNLNQRVSVVASFLTPSIWRDCSGEVDEEVLRRGPCYAGLDLSTKVDLTAFAVTAQDDAGAWHVRPFIFTPGGTLLERARRDREPYDVWRDEGWLEAPPGAALDFSFLARRFVEIAETYPIQAIGFDRWHIAELRREVERLGVELPFVEVGQGFRDMTPAVNLTEQLAVTGRIRAGTNPALRRAVSNVAIERDAAGNRKPHKAKSWGRIDAAVAMMIAFRTSILEEEKAVTAADLLFV